MQFYIYEGKPVNPDTIPNQHDYEPMFVEDICSATSRFNSGIKGQAYYFVSKIAKNHVEYGVILKKRTDVIKEVKRFEKAISIETEDGSIQEVTLECINRSLRDSERRDYINDKDDIVSMFDLGELLNRYGRCIDESILNNRDRNEIYDSVSCLLSAQSISIELDRIYVGTKFSKVSGYPVHYMVITDDADEREGMIQALLSSLYANNRITNRRYSMLSCEPGERIDTVQWKCIFKIGAGGTVIIDFDFEDDSENDLANGALRAVEFVCEMINKYGKQDQIILCLPRKCAFTKDAFYANLGTLSFIELKEDFACGDRARDYLNMLAKEAGIRTDKKLFSKLEEDKGYLATELRNMFSSWYTHKMKTVIYPQYKDVLSADNTVRTAAPRGTSFDELQEMIGLTDAKKVIQQALDYYKAQKLFAARGMVKDHPAMHMVFTGNPGTAKTSVARLFARIMKENGLLSHGDLIEVGRSDLVGKYVGWTAPTVKQKFREARGNVLFIDEAYSLVDDRNGSFGDEAINTIVQEMENHREDMVVIFAGYPDKMEEFLNKNPGLRSRIAFNVPFSDYDTDSLCKIAALIAKGKGLTFSDDAMDRLAEIFDIAGSLDDFGNGRYARNVVEKARMAMASRLVLMDPDLVTDKAITTICPEDLELPVITKQTKRYGFCA